MFEAQVAQGVMWKKIVEAIKELVSEANFQTTPSGIGIQAMDSAHVALVALQLQKGGFSLYECERNAMLGVNLPSLAKILRTTENADVITLRHAEDSDVLSVVADAPDRSKTAEFQLKLMEIDAETMNIPDMEYSTELTMSSAEFAKICKDMSIFGDTVTVQVQTEGVKFSASSDFGDGVVFLRSGAAAADVKREVKTEGGVKKEVREEDAPLSAPAKGATSAEQQVHIRMSEPLTVSFALRYFQTFSKASTLANRVTISLAAEAPCMVQFEIDGLGFLRFYLAPKVEE